MSVGGKTICLLGGGGADAVFFRPTVGILESLKLDIEWLVPELGAGDSENLHAGVKRAIDSSDAALVGFMGPIPGLGEYLKHGKGIYAAMRPVKFFAGCASTLKVHVGIDYVVLCDNPAKGGGVDPGNVGKTAKLACEVAAKRKKEGFPGRVTCVADCHPSAKLGGEFERLIGEAVAGFPELMFEPVTTAELAFRLVENPQGEDTIVAPAAAARIFADVGAATVGGAQLAPRAGIGDGFAWFSSLHECKKGSNAGESTNPAGMLFAAAMLLDYLGYEGEAAKIGNAVRTLHREKKVTTPDKGGTASTEEFCLAVRELLAD